MAKATLIIEDSEKEGCINIHWVFDPEHDDASPAHHMMATVLQHTDTLIKQQAGENILSGVRNAQKEASTGS
jgi:hypothetical protein